MNINTTVLSKIILIIFIVFSIITAILALFLHDSTRTKLKHLSKISTSVGLDQSGADHAMLILHEAENSFQKSFLDQYDTNTAHHLTAYEVRLLQAFNEIDSVIRKKPDTTQLSFEQAAQMWDWYQEKLRLSRKLQTLKHSFDYMLKDALAANAKNQALAVTGLNFRVPGRKFEYHIDTVRRVKSIKKRAFFGRIRDAIANKNGDSMSELEVNHRRVSKVVDSVTQKIFVNDKNVYEQKLKQLQNVNLKVMGTQKKLIAINYEVSDALESIIYDAKEISYKMERELKYSAFKSLKQTAELTNRFFVIAILMTLAFAVLLVKFLIKLNQSEDILRVESQRSIIMAQQKMDLLIYMSHEVRTPLNAIKGFLQVFNKTDLLPRQKEILESIKISSDLLLHTLSDTLDAAKMESSEIKINSSPFNPHLIFKEVIEALGYGAIKKNIHIDYHFKGDEHALVLGDGLRLKQILYNLLSNAIKYTKVGSIIIKVLLLSIKGNYVLYVDIIDTGEGISLEQQANLFSKYYQTNSSFGKMGTGLGLYLCKLLVEMQDGEISATSEINKGSTFSFHIPYE